MAQQIICRMCKKQFFSSAADDFLCPDCRPGVASSGAEFRKDPRTLREMPFSLMFGTRIVSAQTIDISKKGMGIKLFDVPNIPVNEPLFFYIPEIDVTARKGKIVWSKPFHLDTDTEIRVGIEFV